MFVCLGSRPCAASAHNCSHPQTSYFHIKKLLPFRIHNFSLIKKTKLKVLSCQCNIIGRCWPKKFIRSSENSISPCCAISPVIGFFIQLIQVRSQEIKIHPNLDDFLWFILIVRKLIPFESVRFYFHFSRKDRL